MHDKSSLLVVSHPVLATIGREEIQRAIPESQRADGWDHVEILPLREQLGTLHEVDWTEAAAEQERLIDKLLQGEITGHQRLAYFGFAPIPLALHLGYRVERGIKVDVYQRHHDREDWAWDSDDSSPACPLLRPLNLPDYGSTDTGPVVIRVSTSCRIAPADTAEVVPWSLSEIDVALVDTGEDALATRGALAEVGKVFKDALSRLNGLFPNLTAIHLFAAVPVGLAFRLGTLINPTIYPEVVTYQYWRKGSPRYRKAVVLTESRETAFPAKDVIAWNGDELITGVQETFLEMSFLHEGLRVAASVVCLRTTNRSDRPFCATGFLIARDTILTNYHVLYDGSGHPMKEVGIWFNYELDGARQRRPVDTYDGDITTIVGDVKHDWAIIRSSKALPDKYPVLSLCLSKPVAKGDFVYIVQHPAGRLKKIGLLHNQVVHVTQDRVQYLTDTLPGSSGSPVCNEHWEVVALHHRGVRDDAAKMSIHLNHKNQGIRIDRVIEGLIDHGILLGR